GKRLRKRRIASQIGKKHGYVDGDLAGFHHARKHELANRAGVWIHPARTNTKDAEGNGGWPAQRHWYVHLLPAALANSGLRRRHFIIAHLVHRYPELSTVWL